MRESSNLNIDLHHQHEDFHGPSSSSLAAPPPFHFVATSNRNHDWNQHLLLNNGDDQLMAPREFMRPSRDDDVAMVQDLGMFQWPTAADQQGGYSIPWAEVGDLGFDHHQPMANLGGGFGRPGTGFGTVLPTTNISAAAAAGGTSHQLPALLPPPYSNSLGVDHVGRALDLFSNSGRLGRTSLCQLPAAVAVDHNMAYGLGQLQELPAAAQVQASLSRKQVSPSSFGAAHSNGDLEYKATQSVAKKPRLESPRASFTPFKVRKEKLGDRIAALQQLVSPFGKTDTASVLKEARDYIKFLQDQVETLSVPYMRSSNNKKMRTSEETSTEEREEPKLDLRSRGLCLVPLSCTSYVTEENGGVWSPPNYRGGAT